MNSIHFVTNTNLTSIYDFPLYFKYSEDLRLGGPREIFWFLGGQ